MMKVTVKLDDGNTVTFEAEEMSEWVLPRIVGGKRSRVYASQEIQMLLNGIYRFAAAWHACVPPRVVQSKKSTANG